MKLKLIDELNQRYLQLHGAKEDAFWAKKMAHAGYVEGAFEKHEIALKDFVGTSKELPRLRTELARPDLAADEKTGLEGWRRFFEVNAVESAEARALQGKIIAMEGELERARGSMRLGYVDPVSGAHVDAGSEKLTLLLETAPNAALRRAAWEGLGKIETHVLANGFLDVVRERNKLGRMLGFEDYYDYKVNLNEGFSKKTLFGLLDELERETRRAADAALSKLAAERGPAAREPWNFVNAIAGDLTAKLDPYFPFELALERWGRSFAAMGIAFRGATLGLDLMARRGKEENGFMHGPGPGFMDHGTFRPARINFTAYALPEAVGSGYRALATLFHEGGHAAHFSNITMPAPCFSQEYAPTSIAFAETQSMFIDHLVEDADWRIRYARTRDGEPMPVALLHEAALMNHRYLANGLRRLLVVPYAERAIYELPEKDLTPSNVLRVLREVEERLLSMTASPRPVLSVPHLLSGESSAYYHAYVLAQMAVYHTRAHFFERYGHVMDNPAVGRDLAAHYWALGNARNFLELTQALTEKPFSAAATVALVNRSEAEVTRSVDAAIAAEAKIPRHAEAVALDARLAILHGDLVVASTEKGDDFAAISRKFGAWVKDLRD